MPKRVLMDFKLLRRSLSCFIGFVSWFQKAVADLTYICQGESLVFEFISFLLEDFFCFRCLDSPYKKTITEMANLLAKRKLFLRVVVFYLLFWLKSPKFQ
ncbi:hypothetical protein CDG76_34860 [Nostoc sp. 'Peltigera membranacea cyanobiont' 210A]|nr:hypothetical protein CDG76_34860 [Nostoc sp. 'Peltigera membranacea cyanobiont' 210A]